MKQGFVYIMANVANTVMYTGVTSDLNGRAWQHKNGQGGRFSTKYKTIKLVYYEVYDDIYEAIKREKVVNGGSRKRKGELVESMNPGWHDLYDEI